MGAVEIKIPVGEYQNDDALENVIGYIYRHNNPEVVGGLGVYPLRVDDMIDQYYAIRKAFHQLDGKQIFHIVFSFEKILNFSREQLMELGYQIAAYWGNDYQVVFAVHEDTTHKHLHLGINTVAFTNGEYKAFWEVNEVRAYAEKCVQRMIDRRWFGK